MSIIASFTFPYGTEIDADTESRIVNVTGVPLGRDTDGRVTTWTEYQADMARLLPVLGNKVQISVTGMGAPQPLAHIADALSRIERQLGTSQQPDSYVNHRVDVHVPGNSLLAIDELQVVPDACTDFIQAELNSGWRIVAVCPQPDQRRPDYVLGRREPRDD